MFQYFLFKDFSLEEIENFSIESKYKICFFISSNELKDNLEFVLNSKFDYITYSDKNSLNKLNKIKNKYETTKKRRLLFINTSLKINNINQFDIYTNFEYNNSNDGIYKTTNYVNHKFCNLLKEKNKFYFIDIDLINQAIKENDSRIILRIKETIKNLYKKKIKFIITDTSKRIYSKDNYVDLLYFLGIKDKSYTKDLLVHDFFIIDNTIKFK